MLVYHQTATGAPIQIWVVACARMAVGVYLKQRQPLILLTRQNIIRLRLKKASQKVKFRHFNTFLTEVHNLISRILARLYPKREEQAGIMSIFLSTAQVT